NLNVIRDTSQSYTYVPKGVVDGPPVPATQPPPGGAPLNPANFSYSDQTSGISGTFAGDAYAGPVSYLQKDYIYHGGDEMSFIAIVRNAYLVSGAGDEAIVAGPGHNVIDGGTGSNFLTSGIGTDTFFDDTRGGKPIWDTIVNFHPGDALTLWGFEPG